MAEKPAAPPAPPPNQSFDDMMWESRHATPAPRSSDGKGPFFDPMEGGHEEPKKNIRNS